MHACLSMVGKVTGGWVDGRVPFFSLVVHFLIPIPGYRLMGIDRGVYPYFMRVSSI